MPKLTLNTKEVEVLEVEIGENIYKIPLGTELTRKELAALSDQAKVMGYFEKYLGKSVMDKLKFGEISQIIHAWNSATEEASGLKVGESSASRNSRRNTARR